MKKLKWIMPLVASATILTPLATITSCGNDDNKIDPTDNVLEWDFVNDGAYTSQITHKDPSSTEFKDVLNTFYEDISAKPFILLNDIFLSENAIYHEMVQDANVSAYSLKLEITNIDTVKHTISYHLLKSCHYVPYYKSVPSAELWLEYDLDMEINNLPFYYDFKFLEDYSLKEIPCWSFIPQMYLLNANNWFAYLSNLDTNWEINGTFIGKENEGDYQKVFTAPFEHVNKEKLPSMEVFTASELVAIKYSMIFDIYSEYYSYLSILPSNALDLFDSSDYFLYTQELTDPLNIGDLVCCSIDTALYPDKTALEDAEEFWLKIETPSTSNPIYITHAKFYVVINNHYYGYYSAQEFAEVPVKLKWGDQILFVFHPNYDMSISDWYQTQVAFGFSPSDFQ